MICEIYAVNSLASNASRLRSSHPNLAPHYSHASAKMDVQYPQGATPARPTSLAERTKTMTFEEAQETLAQFRDDRDWAQFHNPKDLALSISLEAAELLECFQWSGADLTAANKRAQQGEELADVIITALNLANALGVDAGALVTRKIATNAAKYPPEKARGTAAKYTQL